MATELITPEMSTNEVEERAPRDSAELHAADIQTGLDLDAISRLKPHPEYQYLGLMSHIMREGKDRAMHVPRDQGIRCTLGGSHTYNLQEDGFPVLTTKDVFWRGVTHELRWFLDGGTNIKYLVDNNIHIWDGDAFRRYDRAAKSGKAPLLDINDYIARIKEDDDFAEKWGGIGQVYGAQWRRWPTPDGRQIDQIQQLIDQLRSPVNKYRKSLLVSAWNPSFLPGNAQNEEDEMALPACHVQFQADVDEEDRLSLIMFQRSADVFLGVPFNIASYALLTHLLAKVSGLKAYQFIHQFGNSHVYYKHFEAVREQLTREPYQFPQLELPNIEKIDDFKPGDAKLVGYTHHPRLKAEMIAVGGIIDDPVELQK